MASLNKVMLIGNLGKDPEVRFTPGGQAVANFSIATTERWKGKDGNQEEKTEWHNIVVWGKLAELCREYLHKGRPCFVEGRLQTRSWDDKEGKKRYTTEVVAQTIQFLGGRGETAGAGRGAGAGASEPAFAGGQEGPPSFDTEEDIPF
jgi:single-strand DNA-binding protein